MPVVCERPMFGSVPAPDVARTAGGRRDPREWFQPAGGVMGVGQQEYNNCHRTGVAPAARYPGTGSDETHH